MADDTEPLSIYDVAERLRQWAARERAALEEGAEPEDQVSQRKPWDAEEAQASNRHERRRAATLRRRRPRHVTIRARHQ